MAPWGRGKSTLMKKLQRKFDKERDKLLKERKPLMKEPRKLDYIKKMA
jgi:ABC-type phosphate/phosphonate transport system ATPase subunit